MKDTSKAYLYKHFGENDELLYIGITDDISRRFREHGKGSRWFHLIRKMTFEECETYEDATEREKQQIIELKPIFNIVHNCREICTLSSDPESVENNDIEALVSETGDILAKAMAIRGEYDKMTSSMFFFSLKYMFSIEFRERLIDKSSEIEALLSLHSDKIRRIEALLSESYPVWLDIEGGV